MRPDKYFFLILFMVFFFTISGCSFVADRDREGKIKIEELKPIVKESKVNCDTSNLTQIEITKCEMKARLLELKY